MNRADFSTLQVAALTLLLMVGAGNLRGQELPSGVTREGAIEGTVVDGTTGLPVVGAVVRIRELGRFDFSHGEGRFGFEGVRVGEYTLTVERIGYAATQEPVEVRAGEITRVTLTLTSSAISLSGLVVTGVGRARGLEETYRPTAVLAGDELDRRLSWTLAGTLAHQPGISMKSFGSAPAQPVIRGMGGDRVLVLEDGQRTGDLSTTGADHAVGIDPISAQRVEVVRGPAGLLYGSNALGGVINVIREEVPRTLPDDPHGVVSLQGESVNRGGSAAGHLLFPLTSHLAGRVEGSFRSGGDVRTPLGELGGTDSRGMNAAAGLSWIPGWGFMGASLRLYKLDHGLPGEFNGQVIPGAHPSGASAETLRTAARIQFGYLTGVGPLEAIEGEGSFIHYRHDEIERTLESGEKVIGTSFDQITATLGATARHEHAPRFRLQEGAAGVFGLYRDLITGGAFPGTRDSREVNLAAFVYEELALGWLRVQLGARYDWIRVEPMDRRPINRGDGAVPVNDRTFQDVSGSAAGLVELHPGLVAGASVARAFRSPSVRELYSDGPHLADFSYDIGNPELEREVGLGTDLFLRWNHPQVNFEASLFRNAISNFIHYRPTGSVDPRFFRFPLFTAQGEDAVFLGADGRVQWEASPGFVIDGTLSYVRAEYSDREEPLPSIPPLNGGLRARLERGGWFVTAGYDGTAKQHRVPRSIPNPVQGEPDIVPESPTDGYTLFHLGAGIRWTQGDRVHSVTLNAENVLNTEWRDHLSRARAVAPEPGRNLQLLYRISF